VTDLSRPNIPNLAKLYFNMTSLSNVSNCLNDSILICFVFVAFIAVPG